MIALALRHTNKLIRRTVAESGVRLGRFFTGRAAALEVSELLTVPPHGELRLLDAGAGTGILTAAAIAAVCRAGTCHTLTVDAYENDPALIPTLTDILERIRRRARHDFGVRVKVNVITEDFLTNATGLAEPRGAGERYDLIVCAPPDGAPAEGSAAADFCRRVLPQGTDLAFLFAEAAAARLREDGAMAAILPIAFADSVRAAPLRSRLLVRAPLTALTLDVGSRGSRRDKTLLCHFVYGEEPHYLRVRVAQDGKCEDLAPIPYTEAVFSDEYRILLAKSREDITLVSAMNSLPCRLRDLGLTVKTGLTIETRYKDSLRPGREGGAIPLLHPAGILDGQMRFPPRGRPCPFIIPVIPSLATENRTMVLVKRAPARAEGRHLVVGVYFSGQLPRDRMISTANKLCVIEGISEEMAPDLASGLAAVLSSQYYERYCTLTGRFASVTNAALAALPLPEKDVLLAIGRKLAVARSYSLRASNAVASAALAAYFGGL